MFEYKSNYKEEDKEIKGLETFVKTVVLETWEEMKDPKMEAYLPNMIESITDQFVDSICESVREEMEQLLSQLSK